MVRRVIHTTADFEFIDSMFFSPGALAAGIAAIRAGAVVYCDTVECDYVLIFSGSGRLCLERDPARRRLHEPGSRCARRRRGLRAVP